MNKQIRNTICRKSPEITAIFLTIIFLSSCATSKPAIPENTQEPQAIVEINNTSSTDTKRLIIPAAPEASNELIINDLNTADSPGLVAVQLSMVQAEIIAEASSTQTKLPTDPLLAANDATFDQQSNSLRQTPTTSTAALSGTNAGNKPAALIADKVVTSGSENFVAPIADNSVIPTPNNAVTPAVASANIPPTDNSAAGRDGSASTPPIDNAVQPSAETAEVTFEEVITKTGPQETRAPATAATSTPTTTTTAPPAVTAAQNHNTQGVTAPSNTASEQPPKTEDISLLTWHAERGHAESQRRLGQVYAEGNTVDKDLEQSRLWFELASMQGDSAAQYELGKLYFTGKGVTKDYEIAREWWIESAISGNAQAQQKLGYLYSEGLGVEQDYDKAKNWYIKAANLGNAEAQTLLGSLYHEGNRIPQNYSEAIKWYQLAAKQGHPHAQYTLAILYHDGLGTETDMLLCAAWVEVATANGYIDELGAGPQCRKNLNEQSLLKVEQLSKQWTNEYSPRQSF